MVRTPTSRIGRPAFPEGWSLIELMVVLTIVAAVSSLALPSLRDSMPSLRLSAAARNIVGLLRQAQRSAIESGTETAVVVDLANHSIRSGAGEVITLDSGFAIQITSAASFGGAAGQTQIRFFPDGTSTGGDLQLSYRTRHSDVVVDWLSGRAVLQDD